MKKNTSGNSGKSTGRPRKKPLPESGMARANTEQPSKTSAVTNVPKKPSPPKPTVGDPAVGTPTTNSAPARRPDTLNRETFSDRTPPPGLPVFPSDRRLDLFERIKEYSMASDVNSPPTLMPSEREARLSGGTERSPAGSPDLFQTVDGTTRWDKPSTKSAAAGWKYFLDVPFVPFRRESGHTISLLAVSPYKVMAFFAIDWTLDPGLPGSLRESGAVLKIRDVTGAMVSRNGLPPGNGEDLTPDCVFDITAGTSDRWAVPLWSSHRYLEAWLGFYHEQRFHILARSKTVLTPRGGVSPRTGTLVRLQAGTTLATDSESLAGGLLSSHSWANVPSLQESPEKIPSSDRS